MLDDALAPLVDIWLKSDSGKQFLFEGYIPGKHITKRTIEKIYTNACEKQGILKAGFIHFATALPHIYWSKVLIFVIFRNF